MTSPAKPYRRRPLQVEAVQLTVDADWEAIAQWCGGKVVNFAVFTDKAFCKQFEPDLTEIAPGVLLGSAAS